MLKINKIRLFAFNFSDLKESKIFLSNLSK